MIDEHAVTDESRTNPRFWCRIDDERRRTSTRRPSGAFENVSPLVGARRVARGADRRGAVQDAAGVGRASARGGCQPREGALRWRAPIVNTSRPDGAPRAARSSSSAMRPGASPRRRGGVARPRVGALGGVRRRPPTLLRPRVGRELRRGVHPARGGGGAGTLGGAGCPATPRVRRASPAGATRVRAASDSPTRPSSAARPEPPSAPSSSSSARRTRRTRTTTAPTRARCTGGATRTPPRARVNHETVTASTTTTVSRTPRRPARADATH